MNLSLNPYERAIVRNADWFTARQTREGHIDADGDEFYGLRGDATLIGHSVTVRCLAGVLTGKGRYLDAARQSLEWLAARQDMRGGWRRYSAFTLDGAQCVFEGFNTYQRVTGEDRFQDILVRAADRMIDGTLATDGALRLPNVIEIGEYAHFAYLAWKTTGKARYREAGDRIVAHIARNFDTSAGMWRPFDAASLRTGPVTRAIRPILRGVTRTLAMRGRVVARMSDHLLPYVVADTYPQYAMSLMDAEALIDTLDGSISLPVLRDQTRAAIEWAEHHCAGPFAGSLVESCETGRRAGVYPVAILNDTKTAALWPTACLLFAYCGMNDPVYRDRARVVADWIRTMQGADGGFFNFAAPDGTVSGLQSGNVNYYAALTLCLYNEIYNDAGVKVFTGNAT